MYSNWRRNEASSSVGPITTIRVTEAAGTTTAIRILQSLICSYVENITALYWINAYIIENITFNLQFITAK